MLDSLQERYERLSFEPPKHMWVDNTRTLGPQLKAAIPSLEGVHEDIAHMMMRYSQSLTQKHPLAQAFCGDLSRAIFTPGRSGKGRGCTQYHICGSRKGVSRFLVLSARA